MAIEKVTVRLQHTVQITLKENWNPTASLQELTEVAMKKAKETLIEVLAARTDIDAVGLGFKVEFVSVMDDGKK